MGKKGNKQFQDEILKLKQQLQEKDKLLQQKVQKIADLYSNIEENKLHASGSQLQIQNPQNLAKNIEELKTRLKRAKNLNNRNLDEQKQQLQIFKTKIGNLKKCYQKLCQKLTLNLKQEKENIRMNFHLINKQNEIIDFLNSEFDLQIKENQMHDIDAKNINSSYNCRDQSKKTKILIQQQISKIEETFGNFKKHLNKAKKNLKESFKPLNIQEKIGRQNNMNSYLNFLAEFKDQKEQQDDLQIENLDEDQIQNDKKEVENKVEKIRKELEDEFRDQEQKIQTDLTELKNSARNSILFQFSNDHNKCLEMYNCFFVIQKNLQNQKNQIKDTKKLKQIERAFENIQELIEQQIDKNQNSFKDYNYQGNYLFSFLYKKQIEDLQNQIEKYKEQILLLQEELNKTKQNFSQSNLKNNGLITKDKQFQQEKIKLQNQIKGLQYQVQQLQDNLQLKNDIESNYNDLNQSVQILRQEYASQKNNSQVQNNALKIKDKQIQKLQETIKQMSQENEELNQQLVDLARQRQPQMHYETMYSLNDVSISTVKQDEELQKKLYKDQKNLHLLDLRIKELKKLKKEYMEIQNNITAQQEEHQKQQISEQTSYHKKIDELEKEKQIQKENFQNKLSKQNNQQKLLKAENQKLQMKNWVFMFTTLVLIIAIILRQNLYTKQLQFYY